MRGAHCQSPRPSPLKLASKQKEGLQEYIGIILQLRELASHAPLYKLVEAAISATGYTGYLRDDEETFDDRKANLDALIFKAMEWEKTTENPSLAKFLEELSLRSSLDEAEESRTACQPDDDP